MADPPLVLLPPRIQDRIPERDRWALTEEGARFRMSEAADDRIVLSHRLMEPDRTAEREWFARKCKSDVSFAARHCVWTRDPESHVIPGVKELPFIPFTYMQRPIKAENWTFGGWWEMWDAAFTDTGRWGQAGMDPDQPAPPPKRFAHEKGRRLRFSLAAVIWFWHKFNFTDGFSSFMCTDKDKALDGGDDWNSLLGKFRFIQMMARKFYPWLFVELPKLGTGPYNKEFRIAYPPWTEGDVPINQGCWANEILGYMASDAAGRGSAHAVGFVDEMGWIDQIEAFLDAIEDCTPMLITGSTPPADIHQTFAERRFGPYGYTISTMHWTADPVKARGIKWVPEDEWGWLNPLCEHWRSPYNVQALVSRPRHVYQRNVGLDYRSTAESPVLFTFQPSTQLGSHSPEEASYDYYNPALPVWWFYDVGRADPWAWWAIQYNPDTATVYIIDFWMGVGMTIQWWIPLICGWDHRQRDKWRNEPEGMPWSSQVQVRYGKEDLEVMDYWREKKVMARELRALMTRDGLNPGRHVRFPEMLIGDIQGKQRHGDSQYNIEQRLEFYGLVVRSSSIQNKMEEWLDHTREILPRLKISGRLKGRHPFCQGVTFPSADEIITYWKYLPSTEMGRPARPAHDIYSHGGWSLVYGLHTFPAKISAYRNPVTGERSVEAMPRKCYTTTEAADWLPNSYGL